MQMDQGSASASRLLKTAPSPPTTIKDNRPDLFPLYRNCSFLSPIVPHMRNSL